jgi:hypothetical protein
MKEELSATVAIQSNFKPMYSARGKTWNAAELNNILKKGKKDSDYSPSIRHVSKPAITVSLATKQMTNDPR